MEVTKHNDIRSSQRSSVWLAASLLVATGATAQTAGGREGPGGLDLPVAPSATARLLQLAGGVQVPREQADTVRLTLDDAIQLALKNNAGIALRSQQERFVRGETLAVGNALAPNLQLTAYSRAQEINLAAMGFKPGAIKIPGFTAAIPQIVKVNTTDAQLSLSQQIFNVPAYFLFRAAEKASAAANWETLSESGGVTLAVGGLYLRTLADTAQVTNAEALLKQDQVVFEHARVSRDAGVGINLDVLRAQVELQNEQQQLVRAQNAVAKDKIQLNREMGQPAGQQLDLVDAVPYGDFDASSTDDAIKAALAVAYVRRKDLRGLEAQLTVAEETQKALKYERLPILGVGGFYGVLGETTGLYHGVFAAEGRLSIPVFREAELRGQREVSQAQQIALRQQIASRRSQIEADIRSSLLDVQSAAERVKVSRSNVELASQALSDATLRFTTGVDDSLPVVRAQTAFQGTQAQLIQAQFELNYAKLTLARNTGVVETEYRRYLGR